MKTIHIFSYGEAQIVSKDLNYKTDISNFNKLQSVIDEIKSKKPNNVLNSDYHVINIFCDSKISYISKDKKGTFNLKYSDVDSLKINNLIQEFSDLKPE